MKKILIILFSLAAALSACSETGRVDTAYLGTWRLQNRDNSHTILSLKNNGSFDVDIRLEGQMTKIVEKRGRASGTWESDRDEKRFTLNITQGDPAIGWQAGTRNFTIRRMDGNILLLAASDGRTYQWEKIRRQKTEGRADTDLTSISLAPVVVNLSPSPVKAHQRYKWMCADLEIVLKSANESVDFRPQWKDKVVILLSSKTYAELNTLEKLEVVSGELRDLINPYMDGRVETVKFAKTIVTGNKEAVAAFNAEYE